MASAGGKTNWFVIGVSTAVVVVLIAVGGLVVFLNNQATSPGATPQVENVNSETGAVSFGSGDTVVDTYVDFLCPACNAFEQQYGADLKELAADDKITLNVMPVGALDQLSQGTEYSSRAANALYCTAETSPEAAQTLFETLFANQPAENTTGLDDATLIQYATDAGAKDVESCITDRTYDKFVQYTTKRLPSNANGQRVTPGVVVDGEYVEGANGNEEFASLIADLKK